MSQFRRILYATDFSPASLPAFRRALELARESRARLFVAHVYSPVRPLADDGHATAQTFARLVEDIWHDAERRLDRLVAHAKKRGVRARPLLLEGLPHDSIVRAAKATRADLVVLGTHGRTGLKRMFLGSIAAKVIGLASCPVLTVRAR